MSEEISLNKDERRLLMEELKQKLLSYFTIVIIGGLLMMVLVILLNSKQARFSENQKLLQNILICLSISGFLFFLFLKLRFILSDLSLGKKRIVITFLDNKKISTNYGWHGNVAADLTSQPQLLEYILEIGSKEILVEKDVYDMFEPGDKVEISFGLKSKMLLGIRKVE